jgi:hypothetical protein
VLGVLFLLLAVAAANALACSSSAARSANRAAVIVGLSAI